MHTFLIPLSSEYNALLLSMANEAEQPPETTVNFLFEDLAIDSGPDASAETFELFDAPVNGDWITLHEMDVDQGDYVVYNAQIPSVDLPLILDRVSAQNFPESIPVEYILRRALEAVIERSVRNSPQTFDKY